MGRAQGAVGPPLQSPDAPRRRRRTPLVALVLVACLLGAGILYARPLLLTGTGYAAHNACAVALVADRGEAAVADDLPPNPLVPVGWSMAKSVTNAMVGRLVADGVLDVEDDDLLAVWADDERSAITVDDLLRMASGLEWDEAYSLGSTITAMLYLEPDMGAFAAALPLAAEPGTQQSYSSGTTNVLCDVLAEQYEGDAAVMAHDLVLAPAGMSSAVMEPDAAGDPVCSSYLWATPLDWARFGWWFTQAEGDLLPEGWVDYSTTPDADVSSTDPGHAAHWWVDVDGDLGLPEDAFYASGHDGQRLFIVPSLDLVVVRMGFSPDIPSDELGYDDWVPAIVEAVGG